MYSASLRSLRPLALCTLLFSAILAVAQSNPNLPKAGSIAPALHLNSLIGAPAGTPSELPRNKVVVLEFWATWCVPCLGEIPAINALAHSLDPAKVQFISITDEDPARIRRFLHTHPIAGWVGLGSGSVFDRYGVLARPATIVIGPDGKVVSNTITPDHLSARQLLAIANGKSHRLTPSKNRAVASEVTQAQNEAMTEQFADAGAENAQNALFAITLTPGTGADTHVYHLGPGSIRILDASVKSLLTFGLNIPETRMTIDDDSFRDKRYNLTVNAGGAPPDALASAVELAITSGTHAHIAHHRAEEDVLLLKPTSARKSPPDAAAGGAAFFDSEKQTLLMFRALPADIANAAEDVAGIAVVAEANGVPACNGQFHVTRGDRRALTSALETHCGLTLAPARRTVDRLTVTP